MFSMASLFIEVVFSASSQSTLPVKLELFWTIFGKTPLHMLEKISSKL